MHTLNSSRSAYASVSLARDFFDQYTLAAAASAPSSTPLQCSVLLKSLLAVLRTPHAALDRLAVSLPEPDAPKLQVTLHCLNGAHTRYPLPSYPHSKVSTKNSFAVVLHFPNLVKFVLLARCSLHSSQFFFRFFFYFTVLAALLPLEALISPIPFVLRC